MWKTPRNVSAGTGLILTILSYSCFALYDVGSKTTDPDLYELWLLIGVMMYLASILSIACACVFWLLMKLEQ